jgi:hypothetical protein
VSELLHLPRLKGASALPQASRVVDVAPVVAGAIDGSFQDSAEPAQFAPSQERSEASIADGPTPEMLVVIHMLSRSGTGLVQMEQADAAKADRRAEGAHNTADALRTVEAMAGGVRVTGIEAKADARIAVEQMEEACEVTPLCAHLSAASSRILQQKIDALGRLREESAAASGEGPQAGGDSRAHVVAEVEDNEPTAQYGRADKVVGNRMKGSGAEHAVGGGEVDQVARVYDERRDGSRTKEVPEGGDLVIRVVSASPAAGIAGEDLDAFASQPARPLSRPHEAGADWNVEPDPHRLGLHRLSASRPTISPAVGLCTPTNRETTPPAALPISAAST